MGAAGTTTTAPSDLDKQMAEYWFKHGKGDDPNKVELDTGLEGYWSNKQEALSQATAAVAEEVTASEEA